MKQVKADWAVQSLSFAGFKTRGELLLRGEEALEIIGLMEDSLMVLGSLMSNRWNQNEVLSMYVLLSANPFLQIQCTFQERNPALGPEAV